MIPLELQELRTMLFWNCICQRSSNQQLLHTSCMPHQLGGAQQRLKRIWVMQLVRRMTIGCCTFRQRVHRTIEKEMGA